ncbi:MAG: sensor histidine kinase [Bdellovibrionia bacterium]
MKRWHRFPWQIFWRYFTLQVILFNVIFLIVVAILDARYESLPYLFNEALLNFFVMSLVVSLISSYIFSKPLHSLLLKSLSLVSQTERKEIGPIEQYLFDEEVGEFGDLENTINRLMRKLNKKRDQLLREREENQAILTSISEGIVSINKEGKVLFFNSRFATQFVDPVLLKKESGFTLSEAIRIPEILEIFDKAREESKVQRTLIKINTRVDAQPRFFAISVTPLKRNEVDEVYGSIGIMHDITEIKKAEQIRIEFVDNASHELRTPLTSIKGYVDTLKADIDGGHFQQAPKFLEIIQRNTNRLIDLVNDLLTLRQLESVAEIRREKINPLLISEQVVAELMVLANEKNQMLKISGNAPDFYADSRKVEQVLRNLINNAIKYTPSGKTIEVSWQKGEQGETILKVSDNGPGIPAEHLDRLFERFYRIDKGRTRDAGGTGLGLAIVKHIMQSHGGSVSVSSAPERGAEFTCLFPESKK